MACFARPMLPFGILKTRTPELSLATVNLSDAASTEPHVSGLARVVPPMTPPLAEYASAQRLTRPSVAIVTHAVAELPPSQPSWASHVPASANGNGDGREWGCSNSISACATGGLGDLLGAIREGLDVERACDTVEK
jgi:hypothetical protein